MSSIKESYLSFNNLILSTSPYVGLIEKSTSLLMKYALPIAKPGEAPVPLKLFIE